MKSWAEREGMELPADTHLTMIVQVCAVLNAATGRISNVESARMGGRMLNVESVGMVMCMRMLNVEIATIHA